VRPEPLRGQIWDVDFEGFGEHPAVVLSANRLNQVLGHVAVVPITGTSGPQATHVVLTRDAGLTRYDQSFADVTEVQPVDRYALLRQRGQLAPAELGSIQSRLRVYLGL